MIVDGGEDECLTGARGSEVYGDWLDDRELLINTCFNAWTEVASFISVWLKVHSELSTTSEGSSSGLHREDAKELFQVVWW